MFPAVLSGWAGILKVDADAINKLVPMATEINIVISSILFFLSLGMVVSTPRTSWRVWEFPLLFLFLALEYVSTYLDVNAAEAFFGSLAVFCFLWIGLAFLATPGLSHTEHSPASAGAAARLRTWLSEIRKQAADARVRNPILSIPLVVFLILLVLPRFAGHDNADLWANLVSGLSAGFALAVFTIGTAHALRPRPSAWIIVVAGVIYVLIHIAFAFQFLAGTSLRNDLALIAIPLKVAVFLAGMFAEWQVTDQGSVVAKELIESLGQKFLQSPPNTPLDSIMVQTCETLGQRLGASVSMRTLLGFRTAEWNYRATFDGPQNLKKISFPLVSGNVCIGSADLTLPATRADGIVRAHRYLLEQGLGNYVLQVVRLELSRLLLKVSETDSHEHWLRTVLRHTSAVGLGLRAANIAGTQVSLPEGGPAFEELARLAANFSADGLAVLDVNQDGVDPDRYVLVRLPNRYPDQGLAFQCNNRGFGSPVGANAAAEVTELSATLPWLAFLLELREIATRCARNGELGSSLVDHACRLRLKLHTMRNDLFAGVSTLQAQLKMMPPEDTEVAASLRHVLDLMRQSANELATQVTPSREPSESKLNSVLLQLKDRYAHSLEVQIVPEDLAEITVGLPHYTLLCVLCNLCDNTRDRNGSRVRISVSRWPEDVHLTYVDNAGGFRGDTDKAFAFRLATRERGQGLPSSRRFVEIYGGYMDIMKPAHSWADSSGSWVGAEFLIVMPLPIRQESFAQ
jgi:hypothetical protein